MARKRLPTVLAFCRALIIALFAAAFLVTPAAAQDGSSQITVPMSVGFNFVAVTEETNIADATADIVGTFDIVFSFDNGAGEFRSYVSPDHPVLNQPFPLAPGDGLMFLMNTSGPWVQSLPADAIVRTLVAGANFIGWGGPDTPVREAVGDNPAIRSIQTLNRASGGFDSNILALPDQFNSLLTLDRGTAYWILTSAATTLTMPSPVAAISAAEATQRVLDQVVQPDTLEQNLLLFQHPTPLAPGDEVRPGFTGGAGDGGFVVEASSYLFWVDDEPGALFEHDARFVLVDSTTGGISVSNEQWWPVLNGVDLFTDDAEYWNPDNRAFSRLAPDPTPLEFRPADATGAVAQVRREIRVAQTPLVGSLPSGECLLLINGWSPGEGAESDLRNDIENWSAFAAQAGYEEVITVTPPKNKQADFENALRLLNANPDCRDVTIFITAHGGSEYVILGGEVHIVNELVERLAAADLLGIQYKVILTGCKTSSWVDNLTAVSNVEIVITATDADRVSFGDIDIEGLGFTDPNPEDTGTEFMSGFVEDLNILMGSATAISRMQRAAADSNVPFAQVLYHCAFESAVAKDAMALRGWTEPQRYDRDPIVNKFAGRYGTITRAFPCPEPDGFLPD